MFAIRHVWYNAFVNLQCIIKCCSWNYEISNKYNLFLYNFILNNTYIMNTINVIWSWIRRSLGILPFVDSKLRYRKLSTWPEKKCLILTPMHKTHPPPYNLSFLVPRRFKLHRFHYTFQICKISDIGPFLPLFEIKQKKKWSRSIKNP
jgi:hypothetical protein